MEWLVFLSPKRIEEARSGFRNAFTDGESIGWLSPLKNDKYAEYRDQAFLDKLEIRLEKIRLEQSRLRRAVWYLQTCRGLLPSGQSRRVTPAHLIDFLNIQELTVNQLGNILDGTERLEDLAAALSAFSKTVDQKPLETGKTHKVDTGSCGLQSRVGALGERKNPKNQPLSSSLPSNTIPSLFQHSVQRSGSIDAENLSDDLFLGSFCFCNAV